MAIRRGRDNWKGDNRPFSVTGKPHDREDILMQSIRGQTCSADVQVNAGKLMQI